MNFPNIDILNYIYYIKFSREPKEMIINKNIITFYNL